MNIGGVELAVRVAPERPTFLWGHGLLSTMQAEDEAGIFDWSSLAPVARLVRYDARGHGGSERSTDEHDYRWPSLAEDHLAVADAVGAERFVAGGASMGAATALHAAVARPDRVLAMVLVIPPTAWSTRALQATQYRLGARTIATVGLQPFVLAARLAPPSLIMAEAEHAREATLANLERLDRRVVPHVLRGAAASDLPEPEELAELDQPTLVLAWRGDPVHPVGTAKKLAEVLPNADLAVASSLAEVKTWPKRVSAFLAGLDL